MKHKEQEEIDAMIKEFKERAFSELGLVIEKDDPVFLVYLMIDFLADGYSQKVSLSLENAQARINELSKMWTSREDESFKEYEKVLEGNTQEIDQLIDRFFEKLNSAHADELETIKKYLNFTLKFIERKTKNLLLINSLLLFSNIALLGVIVFYMV